MKKLTTYEILYWTNDLDQADELVRNLFEEWTTCFLKPILTILMVSDVGYSTDEIKRIEFREKLDAYSNMVSAFNNSEFF